MVRFADTFYFVALLEERDQHHLRVREFAGRDEGHLVTTRWILMEVANTLASSSVRSMVAQFLVDLESDPSVRIIAEGEGLYRRGLDLYRARPDKEWSLTDCISFVVMDREGLREALIGDRHFSQAGFVPLFAE